MRLRSPLWKKNKTYKRPYTKSKRFDVSCRNHGSCSYCSYGRQYKKRKALQNWHLDLQDFLSNTQ